MQGPQAAKRRPRQIKVQRRPGELRRDDQADREAGDAPDNGCDGSKFDRPQIVVGTAVDLLRRKLCRAVVVPVEDREAGKQACRTSERRVECKRRIVRKSSPNKTQEREHSK
jgi:hypothetical protein